MDIYVNGQSVVGCIQALIEQFRRRRHSEAVTVNIGANQLISAARQCVLYGRFKHAIRDDQSEFSRNVAKEKVIGERLLTQRVNDKLRESGQCKVKGHHAFYPSPRICAAAMRRFVWANHWSTSFSVVLPVFQ
ncbi:hypothetical protein WJ95_15715 [Burkholderia ubonensis]|nr:hypothetical protein WJ83_26230 [Burkholderia ubonensis]KVP87182.1 hypothetical protein WJ95_15715 [Burkholderia ubonensis]KVW74681.1 hypothetical protein WK98_02565 [Burkholderia ubonensis]